jgi:hypothetical protein
MPALPMSVAEGFWRRLLETLYTGLEERDVSGYAWDTSDGWTQSRTPEQWRAHLECWIAIGGFSSFDAEGVNYNCRLIFALRYHAEDDSIAQARMHAAIRDACEYLIRVRLTDGIRVTALSDATLEGPIGDWIEVTVGFTLYVPR